MLSIDLSLRSTGMVYRNGDTIKYKLINPPKEYNDESLLVYIKTHISLFIQECKPTLIGLEGLSFGSVSSSKDIIAGNFWCVREMLFTDYPSILVEIIPVLTWRSPLFNKDERKKLKEIVLQVKLLKKEMETLSKVDKKALALENEELIRLSDIKYQTWLKVPEPYKTEFETYGGSKGKFDLSDAYFICEYLDSLYEN